MAPLPTDLRRTLETSVIKARDEAERAAAAALAALAFERNEAFPAMTDLQRSLRTALRARAKQLGNGNRDAGVPLLVEEVAYVQWHRMLFARFLAENDLLMHPAGVPVTLEECGDLAAEEGEADAWQLAARYAGMMLPGIFRPGDPTATLRFAPEGRAALERVVVDLPALVFTADDALGWVYQFWQTKRKKQVNESGRKIGGADISPVTQLFTEHYMVQFLLENSLGAWWAARHPASPLVREMPYLRFQDDGTPAAGTFPGWPSRAAEITMIDPCCGSGHFLVAAFEMLRRMRMEEEKLDERAAADATIRDNIFGLELDPRCTQIAAFALAFAAWKRGGYRSLPALNIACSGIPVQGQLEDWTALAEGDDRLRGALERLYHLFKNAPDLGSLINPAELPLQDRMFSADYSEVEPLLARALQRERRDPAAEVFGAAAEGVAKAARLLAAKYTLVATNVPYMSRGKQGDVLRQYCETHHAKAKADLATAFIERSRSFSNDRGTYSLVTPQNWLFLGAYKDFRHDLLLSQSWVIATQLGMQSFQTPMYDFNIGLYILSNGLPRFDYKFVVTDVSEARGADNKSLLLQGVELKCIQQNLQLKNPDARIVAGYTEGQVLFSEYADSYQGICTGDYPRFGRCFWEMPCLLEGWIFQQSTTVETRDFAGREHVLLWQNGNGDLHGYLRKRLGETGLGAWIRGLEAWDSKGVCVSQMGSLPISFYNGGCFDNNAAVIIPKDSKLLPAIWAFCKSAEFSRSVRQIDTALKVTNLTLLKVPFDLARWQKVAEEAGPLPEPHSDDPTQWLFNGRPRGSDAPLQVAVARLLGYRWPQNEHDGLDLLADEDGIACLPSVARELPAEERLRALLARAYGAEWSGETQSRLLAEVGGKDLAGWLRDDFFKQHCAMFHNRPFIWHIWDGRRDGFAALVNYHKLDATRLDKLIYSYLGSWIETQRAAANAGSAGADGRLIAALELQTKLIAIRTGEPPYDIYVRWKPLREQPIGWNPDLNDGVRLNIRPFITAGVLRTKFTVNWNKDRGTNPDGSERLNDLHLAVAEKRAARGE